MWQVCLIMCYGSGTLGLAVRQTCVNEKITGKLGNLKIEKYTLSKTEVNISKTLEET